MTTAALRPDSFFDAPVFLDDGFILASPDTPITPELVARLQKWGYTTVSTDGNPVDAPAYLAEGSGVARVTSLEDDIKDRHKLEQARQFHGEFQEFARQFYRAFTETNALPVAGLTEMLKKAIAMLKSNGSMVLRFAEFDAQTEDYLVDYSIHTALLSIAVGEYLKLPPHKLIELGVAAFLHDIGMTKVAAGILSSGKPLTPEERKNMMAHTVIGYKLLKAYNLSEDVALGALEHHERADGSGYPRRLPPAKQSLYGRIIAAACSYVASTSRRRYKTSRDGHAALRDLFSRRQYDPTVIKALLYTLSLFPLGTYVLLSNQAQGVVVQANAGNPRLPVVRMLVDPAGEPVTKGALVRTSEEEGEVTVQRSLTRQEIERLKAKVGA